MEVKFKDPNFRIAVLQILMYEQDIFPAFDVWEFAKTYQKRKIDIEKEGYDVIPEVMDYFNSLIITPEMLESIEEIYQDGGNDIYLNIIPFWDGEDDLFNITQTEDAALLPNLKKITLFYDDAEKMVKAFKKVGLDAEYL